MKTTKSRIIFFAIALTYNLLLGLYLKDFLVLSQTLMAFYLFGVAHTISADRATFKGYEGNYLYRPGARYTYELNLFRMLPQIAPGYDDVFACHRADVLHYFY